MRGTRTWLSNDRDEVMRLPLEVEKLTPDRLTNATRLVEIMGWLKVTERWSHVEWGIIWTQCYPHDIQPDMFIYTVLRCITCMHTGMLTHQEIHGKTKAFSKGQCVTIGGH